MYHEEDLNNLFPQFCHSTEAAQPNRSISWKEADRPFRRFPLPILAVEYYRNPQKSEHLSEHCSTTST